MTNNKLILNVDILSEKSIRVRFQDANLQNKLGTQIKSIVTKQLVYDFDEQEEDEEVIQDAIETVFKQQFTGQSEEETMVYRLLQDGNYEIGEISVSKDDEVKAININDLDEATKAVLEGRMSKEEFKKKYPVQYDLFNMELL